MSVAASRLGYHVHIYCPEADCPAAEVSKHVTIASYDDMTALETFAASVDVVTLEFENVPLTAARCIEQFGKLAPSSRVLEICQHRVKEKQFINDSGIATAHFKAATNIDEARTGLQTIGAPCILKTCTMGYDGKGQVKINDASELDAAWAKLASDDVVIEGFVPFEKEASILVVRGADKQTICYPLVENIHKHHILHQTIAPAELPQKVMDHAITIATTLANKLDLVGIVAVELFVCEGGELRVNELAPRPHNSGHWTMDACQIDQFEQTIRAVAGLPLLPVGQHSRAIMTNIIGDDIADWKNLASAPHSNIHLYGKADAKPGRKMGHITQLISHA